MSLVISNALVLDPVETGPDHPLVGYDNLVTVSNISASHETVNYPATNLANPATHLKWLSDTTGNQSVTIALDGLTEVDYVGIVGHNFGTAQISVEIDAAISGSPISQAGPAIPVDDGPLLFRFSPLATTAITLSLVGGSQAPSAAVVYVGKLLVMERRLYGGHTPLSQARKLVVSNGRSESGEFLGRIVTGEDRASAASFRLFTPAWYRANMPDFLLAAKEQPFFFAWRPASYPNEVGYAWLTDDPVPVPEDAGSNNLIAFQLGMGGVA